MRIAITGPTGAIGSELVELLIGLKHEVIAITRPNSSKRSNLVESPNLEVIEADISDYKSLLGKNHCDLFYHLAWKETYGEKRDDSEIQLNNIQYSLDAVKLADSWGAKKFIGTGSQAEFGPSNQILTSSTPVNPESGYGIAKYTAGKLCNIACQRIGMDYNWVRVISVYGDKDKDYTLVMYLIHTMLKGQSPELTKCEQIWDYTYSKDVARALYAIGISGKNGKVYVLGSGKSRRLMDYVEVIRNIINPKIELKFGAREYYPHQPMFLSADLSELTDDTGYYPIYSFEEGISNTIEYVKNKRMSSDI